MILALHVFSATSHTDICASIDLELDAIRELCSSSNVAVRDDAGESSCLALQSLNAITGGTAAMVFKAVAWERMFVFEESTASLPAG